MNPGIAITSLEFNSLRAARVVCGRDLECRFEGGVDHPENIYLTDCFFNEWAREILSTMRETESCHAT